MNIIKTAALTFIIFFIISVSAFSQDNSTDKTGTAEPVAVISKINYLIDGTTKEKALRNRSDLYEGLSFSSYSDLEAAVKKEKQALINRRVFKNVEYSIESISFNKETNTQEYLVTFKIKDAFTIIPIPYPKYDSNIGFRLGLKLYWDNFLGTMTNAYLGTWIDFNNNGVGEWGINPKFTGMKISDRVYMSVEFLQSHELEEYVDTINPSNSYNYDYYATSGAASFSFRLGDKLAYIYKSYSFGLGASFKYKYKGNLGPNFEQPWAVTPFQSFGIGRTDWINNFRKGWRLSLYNPYRIGYNNNVFFITSVNASVLYFVPFWKRFDFYSRAYTFYQWGEPRSFGEMIRGVKDTYVSGYAGVVLNASLAFQFWRFEKVWDAQIHPFFDFAVSYNKDKFIPERDINYGAGFDFALYLDALPSIVAVASIGVDIKRLDMDNLSDCIEVSVGSSLHY